MRKVILGCAVTLDGYIARPDGSLDYLEASKDAMKKMTEFWATIDVVLFGRKTFDAVLKMTGGKHESPVPTPAYVFSKSQPPGPRGGVTFVKQSPASFVRKLRRLRGKNIYHMGGGELARSFLEADLVDELALEIFPVLLGEGIPLFPAKFPERKFSLVEATPFSKMTVLHYRRVRTKPRRKPQR